MAQVQVAEQTKGKIPFRYGSRQRIQRVTSLPYQAGQTVSTELPRVGFVAGILLNFTGTSANATGTGPRGIWPLVNRVRLNLNLGAAVIYDVTGYGTYLVNLANGKDLSRVKGFSTASNVNFSLYIPVAVNLSDAFTTGLILLQDPQVRATLEVVWGNPSDAFTGTNPTVNGTMEVHYVYWEVPDFSRVSAPPLVLHRIVEEIQPISQTGDNVYTIPRQGTLLQLLHVLELNGALSDAWERHRIILNRVDTIRDISRHALYTLDVVDGHRPMSEISPWPVGLIVADLYRAMGTPGAGDLRDALDTEVITTTESVVTVSANATLGANNNFLRSIRRILQPIRV